jgi:hypothetical protein
MACAEDAAATPVVAAVVAVLQNFFYLGAIALLEEQEETHLTRTAA